MAKLIFKTNVFVPVHQPDTLVPVHCVFAKGEELEIDRVFEGEDSSNIYFSNGGAIFGLNNDAFEATGLAVCGRSPCCCAKKEGCFHHK
jgi:hypothetical protein